MNDSRAKITYLHHSGFAVETAGHLFVFDYYQPDPARPGDLAAGVVTAEYLKDRRGVYVFVSHRHPDHFDPAIFAWATANPAITYVLSSDIRRGAAATRTQSMAPYEEWRQETVTVKTFGSTDEGLSFLVRADGLSIFHAGDLNWWHWKGETKAEQAYAESIFKAEIEKLAPEHIDIAFFPVDRRLEEYYSLGAEYFAAKLQPKLLVPMHFGDDFGASAAFAHKAQTANTAWSTVEITRRGQVILF